MSEANSVLQTSPERQKTTPDISQRLAQPLSRTDQHSVDVASPVSSSLTSAGENDSLAVENRKSSTEGKPMIIVSDFVTVLV